jgi:thiol-disulfide isomerase/thioredoxin
MAIVLALVIAASVTLDAVLGAASWMGGRPAAADVQGKVVLLDVFTVDCINCQHVVPELRKLNATLPRKDFRIIGIHTPETPYERDPGHVSQSLREQGITWPVAVDNDGAVWNAYGLEYWPTQMIFDRRGHLRKTVIGEGQDEVVQRTVEQLLHE